MDKIKLTKSELKAQCDALKRFSRFLPTLQLKKLQLQREAQKSQEKIENNKKREVEFKYKISEWISMFGRMDEVQKITKLIRVLGIDTYVDNIAGVSIPIYSQARFSIDEYDLFRESPWIDDAIKAVCNMIEIKAERDILIEQYKRIVNELKVTSQRVNLFEKVKIPESKENIKKIQIYIGDQFTSAVGRAKIAKRKLAEVVVL